MKRYVWVKGRLRQVKDRWVWLFKLFDIGFELPDETKALREVMQAMETYHRKCQVYLRA